MPLHHSLLSTARDWLTFYWQRFRARRHRLQLSVHARGWCDGLKSVLRSATPANTSSRGPTTDAESPPRQPPIPGRQQILWIDATTPRPDRDAGSLRAFNLMRLLLHEGHTVDFMPDDGVEAGPYTDALRTLGVGLPARTSRWPTWISAWNTPYDSLIISRYHLAQALIPLVRQRQPKTQIVLDTIDLHHLREQREATFRHDPHLQKLAERTRQWELATIAAADLTWVVSPDEAEMLSKLCPDAPCFIVPTLHEAAPIETPFAHRCGVLFVGGAAHPPNIDAVYWLITEIIPRVQQQIPHCPFHLVGAGLKAALPRKLSIPDGVKLHGHVPDLASLLGQCRVSIAPLRFGAGVNGKINQAMAAGLPVVSTRRLRRSLRARHGEDILLGDDAQGLADAIIRVHEDATLWVHLVHGGLKNIRRYFSSDTARDSLTRSFPLKTPH